MVFSGNGKKDGDTSPESIDDLERDHNSLREILGNAAAPIALAYNSPLPDAIVPSYQVVLQLERQDVFEVNLSTRLFERSPEIPGVILEHAHRALILSDNPRDKLAWDSATINGEAYSRASTLPDRPVTRPGGNIQP